MNYRHIYHAGNFADIFKHFIVYLILDRLKHKDTACLMLDAFAGIGLYPLNSTESLKTREFETGVSRLMNAEFTSADLQSFKAFLEPDWNNLRYAGSPMQIQKLMRSHDRLVANELHPDDFKSLSKYLSMFKNVTLTNIDAYNSIKAQIPPAEKRGFILIDPPFEKQNEFELLTKNIKLWQEKFPQGHYAIWYPIKAQDNSLELNEYVKYMGFSNSYRTEFLRHPRSQRDSFNGCGMLLLNAPFTVIDRLRAAQSELETCLNGKIEIESLTTT